MPLSTEQLSELSKPKRTLKILCGSLLGIVCIVGLFIATKINFADLESVLTMLVALAAASGAVMYFLSFITFNILSTQTQSRSDMVKGHFQTIQIAWIVRFAIIQGACVLNLIVTLLENSLISLFVALVGVLIMVVGFPRSIKAEELLEERM